MPRRRRASPPRSSCRCWLAPGRAGLGGAVGLGGAAPMGAISTTATGPPPGRSPCCAAPCPAARCWCRRRSPALAWMLMIAAMMLPTALPLFNAFDRLASARARPLAPARAARPGLRGGVGRLRPAGACAARRCCWPRSTGVPGAGRHAWLIGAATHRAGRRLPVQPPQAPLPRQVPHAAQLRHRALARPATGPAGLRARCAPRPVLRRLLLGADAADVRRRRRQPRLDAAAGGADGGREEPRPGAGASARRSASRCSRWAPALAGWRCAHDACRARLDAAAHHRAHRRGDAGLRRQLAAVPARACSRRSIDPASFASVRLVVGRAGARRDRRAAAAPFAGRGAARLAGRRDAVGLRRLLLVRLPHAGRPAPAR